MSAATGESAAGAMRSAELAIGGMTCASCAARIAGGCLTGRREQGTRGFRARLWSSRTSGG
jgi:hypothetical protein